MNNVNYIPWIIATSPIVAAVLFMNFRSPTAPPSSKIEPSPAPLNQIAEGTSIKPTTPREPEPSRRLTEATKRANASRDRSIEASRKVGEMHTPEFCNEFADRIMKKREPEYRKIFSAWNIGKDTSAQVLEILREREFRQAENRGNYMRNSAPLGSGKAHEFEQQTEDLVANEQLALLLGETRTSELVKAADRMQAAEIQTALSAAGLPNGRPK